MYDKQRLLLYHPDSNRMMFTSVNKLGHRVPETLYSPKGKLDYFHKQIQKYSKKSVKPIKTYFEIMSDDD